MIYQQGGLLTSEGKEIKNKPEILALLKALMKPAKVSIIHCPGHQKGNSLVSQGNNQADQEARAVATGTTTVMALKGPGIADPKFKYMAEDLALITKNATICLMKRWAFGLHLRKRKSYPKKQLRQ